jgi:hypothetical protein
VSIASPTSALSAVLESPTAMDEAEDTFDSPVEVRRTAYAIRRSLHT